MREKIKSLFIMFLRDQVDDSDELHFNVLQCVENNNKR